MFPCLRFGAGSRFESAVSSAEISTGRVRRGSITSSTYPRSAAVYQHGSLLLKLFSPVDKDTQQPHTQDELYFVAQGRGWFVNGEVRHAFQTGDALFVPAGVMHRFEDFSEDVMLWVVFYGPQGGEQPAP